MKFSCKIVNYETFTDGWEKTAKDVQGKMKLYEFLSEVLPDNIPLPHQPGNTQSRQTFITDVMDGMAMAPMSVRLTPHILSSVDWDNPLGDPLSRQYIPKKSTFQPDHPKLSLDSLHEKEDSPCEGLVHRYTDKCLFLGKLQLWRSFNSTNRPPKQVPTALSTVATAHAPTPSVPTPRPSPRRL